MNDQKLIKALKIAGLVFCSVVVCLSLFGCLLIYGPAESLRHAWINYAMSGFRHRYLAEYFFSSEYISLVTNDDEPIIGNDISGTETLNTDTVSTEPVETTPVSEPLPSGTDSQSLPSAISGVISVEDVSRRGDGGYFVGYMMIVKDPSLLRLEVSENPDGKGESLLSLCARTDAIAGINAVDFAEADSPSRGYILKDGQIIRRGTSGTSHTMVGIDGSGQLLLKVMTDAEVNASGLQCGVEAGSLLIVDGQSIKVGITEICPRSAIGQRADGAYLLLVVDGRSTVSVGASQADIISVMEEYGAVNAADLNGGNASAMVLNGELISKPSSDVSLSAAFTVSEPAIQ